MAAAMAKFLWVNESFKVLRDTKADSSNESYRCGRSSLSRDPSSHATTKETPLTSAKKIGMIQSSRSLSERIMRTLVERKVLTHPVTEKRRLWKRGGMG